MRYGAVALGIPIPRSANRQVLTGKWTKARYRAELHEIHQRYWEWETIGPPEIRQPIGGTFSPYGASGEPK